MLFLVASGLTLVFGVGRVFNFAHASFYMIGAYLAYQFVKIFGANFWLGVIIATVGAGIVGLIMEVGFLKRIYGRTEEAGQQILLTFGFVWVFDDLVKMTWGPDYKAVPGPPELSGSISVAGAPFPIYNLFIIIFGLVVVFGIWWALLRTNFGRIVRAGSIDREMLGPLGINIGVVMTSVFAFACALGGLSGALFVPLRTACPGMWFDVIIEALIIVIIGGLGNFWGAWLGSLIIGMTVAFGIMALPRWGILFIYIAMVIILALRPQGLLGKR